MEEKSVNKKVNKCCLAEEVCVCVTLRKMTVCGVPTFATKAAGNIPSTKTKTGCKVFGGFCISLCSCLLSPSVFYLLSLSGRFSVTVLLSAHCICDLISLYPFYYVVPSLYLSLVPSSQPICLSVSLVFSVSVLHSLVPSICIPFLSVLWSPLPMQSWVTLLVYMQVWTSSTSGFGPPIDGHKDIARQ